jgi:hypothetical protein
MMMLHFSDYPETGSYSRTDIYVPQNAEPQNAGLTLTNLIFAPFGHKTGSSVDAFFDYWNWGSYIDSEHGNTTGEFKKIWPRTGGGATYGVKKGMPFFPISYENTHIWVLDGATDRYLRILQGVNLTNGSIYSNRPTIIGGGIVAVGDEGTVNAESYNVNKTTDNINSGLDGYLEQGEWYTYEANYINTTTMWSETITNSDIVLLGSGTKTLNSLIRRPDNSNWERLKGWTYTSDEVSLTIKGGTIYVGSGQRLTIEGTTTGVKSASDSTVVPLDNMWITPDKIIVAAGGELVIAKSETTNVLTDIYVDGGTLNIQSGAKIKGNIYAYKGAKVNIADTSLSTMKVSPDKIVVGKDATLTIGTASYLNVQTDIYVDGGTLIILPLAWIKGNIYAYNDGRVDIRVNTHTAAFRMELKGANDKEKRLQGIFIYGMDTAGSNGITTPGRLIIPRSEKVPDIDFRDDNTLFGAVHLVGGDWKDLISNGDTSPPKLPPFADVAHFLCEGYDERTGRCQHYVGSTSAESWITGSFGDG